MGGGAGVKLPEREKQFPLGATVTHEMLEADPYPFYARLRAEEPVSWLPPYGMYFATRHDLCRQILMDDKNFIVGWETSTVYDILGPHMMSSEGAQARRYKNAHRRTFMPANIRATLEARIVKRVHALIDDLEASGRREAELRTAFASRLPIQVMLDVFGLPQADEPLFRSWYDAFERALANEIGDPDVRAMGKATVSLFHDHIQAAIERMRSTRQPGTLLDELVHAEGAEQLADDEIRHNCSIVMFGGISTVEALILNTLSALARHDLLARVSAERDMLPVAMEETIRWMGPVQSATRYVTAATEIGGVALEAGDVINCILGAANRDPDVFPDPDRFDMSRTNLRDHLSFVVGPHLCLGMHLARAEGRIAVSSLFDRLPGLRVDLERTAPFRGSVFRQPEYLTVAWG